LILGLNSLTANATMIEYDINQKFTDGSTAIGTIEIDNITNLISGVSEVVFDAQNSTDYTFNIVVSSTPIATATSDFARFGDQNVLYPQPIFNDVYLTFADYGSNPILNYGGICSGSNQCQGELILDQSSVTPVPLPSALPLLISGLIGFGVFRKKNSKA
jgi:hypothetical protein